MFDAYTSSEVAFKLPYEVSSVNYRKKDDRILAAVSKCDLLVCAPAKGRPGYEYDNLVKRFSRKPVQAMKVVEEAACIITFADQVISLHSLVHPYPVKGIVKVAKPVYAFAAHVDPKTAELYITVAQRKKFSLWRWVDDDFLEITNCDLAPPPDNPILMCWAGKTLCYAVRDAYHMNILTHDSATLKWKSESRRLFPVGEVPCIVDMPDRKLVGFTRGDIFTAMHTKMNNELSKTPSKLPQDVKFTDTIVSVAWDAPYVVGLLPRGRIEVRSLFPPLLIQSITLSKAVMLVPATPGRVCVGAAFDMWMLDARPSLRKNVAYLIAEKHYDLAVQLTESCGEFDAGEKADIKRQAAGNLFNQCRFDEAFAIHAKIKSNVISVLSLFPDLLPEKYQQKTLTGIDLAENQKKLAMQALGKYLTEVRYDLARELDQNNRAKNGDPHAKLLSPLELDRVKNEMLVVDTTLLKCYLKTKPMMVGPLLRLRDNSCSFDDAESMLRKEGQLQSLYILYETRKKHHLALSLLREQAAVSPQPESFFCGVEQTIDYLHTLGNTHLNIIFEFARWVMVKDPQAGLTIFTGDESELAKNYDREAVLDFLQQECMEALIPYLEHVIYKWGEDNPRLHETLLEQYVRKVKELLKEYTHAFHDDDNVIRAGHEEGELGVYRRKMLKFLHHSLNYSPSAILVQLNHYAFCEERALILGRLKKHEEAIAIYTGILHDFVAAESYCRLYYNVADPVDAQVYLHLLRAYLCPSESLSSGALLFSEALRDGVMPPPQPNVPLAIKVLSRHAHEMDAVAALSLMPDSVPLHDVVGSLSALVQATSQELAEVSVRHAISTKACERSEQRLKEVSSTKIVITANTQCAHCEKKIGTSAFVRFPKSGELEHLYCYESHTNSDRPKVA